LSQVINTLYQSIKTLFCGHSPLQAGMWFHSRPRLDGRL
jgi:hypothetical protein